MAKIVMRMHLNVTSNVRCLSCLLIQIATTIHTQSWRLFTCNLMWSFLMNLHVSQLLPFYISLIVQNNLYPEICAILGYYAASCGYCLPTFQDNVSVTFSRVKTPSSHEKKTPYISWFSVSGLMMALWAEIGSLITCCKPVCFGFDCTTEKSKIYFCMYMPTGMSNI